MGAKVRDLKGDGAWWVVVNYRSRRKCIRYGKLKKDRARAEKVAAAIDAKITGEVFEWRQPDDTPRSLACDDVLDAHLESHRPTWGLSTFECYRSLAKTHLKPFFRGKDLRTIKKADVLKFIGDKHEAGLSVQTIRNALRVLSAACVVLVEDRELDRNPLTGMGKLLAKVARQKDAKEPLHIWTADQVKRILALAWKHEREALAGLLDFLFGTGCRLGEALALQWSNVDFKTSTARIVRSARNGRVGPTKTHQERTIALPGWLVSQLRERHEAQHRAQLTGKPVPSWVFPSRQGTVRNGGNVSASWQRFRRRLQREGIPGYRIHDARHTYASLAMESGMNVVRLAEQLGHADPTMTLRVYSHAVPDAGLDLGFATFGNGTIRHQPSPPEKRESRGGA